ncbi:YdcF family protein [Methylobacterium radiodurans]|uniref:YdcF family protein n=1 Tax=Methylobacterium radiodurans TaxID=2202828 RepID=A0A2U8VMS4_9HYPH|nr:YdcF family protein [Methylobacterium radiodurans]AWN34903.1 YdcF family protein [Methylobacterium radiodurans]
MPCASESNAGEPFGWRWDTARSLRTGESVDAGRPKPRLRRLGLGLLAGTGLGGIALGLGFLGFVDGLVRLERVPVDRADGIVVLTGGAQRIGDAIDLLAAGYGRRLLITGVNERTSRDEIARLNPSQRDLIACCVDLDYRARNTIGNAIETRRWMRRHRFGTVAVVTSNYHMPRTLIELDHVLEGADHVIPHPVVADGFDAARWWQCAGTARLLAAEYAKFLVAWVRTRFEDDPEQSRAAILIGRGKPVKMVAEPGATGALRAAAEPRL